MRTALVTGGAGFIGSHLVSLLHNDGWHVIIVDDLRSSPVPLATVWRDWQVESGAVPTAFLVAAEDYDYRTGPKPDAVFHLAGPVGATGVLPQAGTIAGSIVGLAETVRDWALWADCPLVYVGTSESYGTGGECHERSDRTFPAGATARREYAVAKLLGETLLLNTRHLDVRIVRPFNVAGPRHSGRGGFATPRFVAQAMAGLPLTVHEPGTQERAFCHVADEVDGIYRALTHGRAGGAYNLGRPENRTTVRAYAELVLDVVGGPSTIEIVDPGYPMAVDKWPAFSEAAAGLGWTPTRTLRDIVADSYAYMQRPNMAEILGAL